MTLQTLSWPEGKGPNIIVDDGGDATMLLLQGSEWEVKFEKDGSLPDPATATSEE